MIKANELRIGNLVLHEGSFKEVAGIDATYDIPMPTYYDNRFDDGVGDLKGCEAIPITPEWLKKFGFSENGSSLDLGGNFDLSLDLIRGELWIMSDSTPIRRLVYVHQLQNTYFALTDEELIFKEN